MPGQRARLMEILTGGWLAQCCYALAKLGIADHMAAGPRPVADLAAASRTDPRALTRMLRAMAGAGLLTQPAPDTFGLTEVSALLRSDAYRSSRDVAIMFGEEVFRSFAEVIYTLRSGQPAFDKVYGRPFYDYLADNPEAAQTFSAAMGDAPVPAALAGCDLGGAGTLVDVGGGNGALLARLLRAHPAARGILVEMPPAAVQARARLARAGVADRVEFAEGSFFDPLPSGGDVYVLSRVLHNWADDEARAVLRRVREAIATAGRLLIAEELTGQPESVLRGDGDGDGVAGGGSDAGGSLTDLLIMLTLAGCDRSEQEYCKLLDDESFSVIAVRPPPPRDPRGESVIEAVPRLPGGCPQPHETGGQHAVPPAGPGAVGPAARRPGAGPVHAAHRRGAGGGP